jgi:ubiquinone/menaquinone biosynthesis C-methylase UbiE
VEKEEKSNMEREELHGDTYVLDSESPIEMTRLIDLDRIITRAMGGALSGIAELPEQAQVLDLACGPGGWVLDVAFASPESEVAGVDVSQTMIAYANARARSQGLSNATFGVMDVTQPLDFSDQTFDLVNARLLVGVLKRESWQPFLGECLRLLKPGGTLRLTELVTAMGTTNSRAHNRISAFMCQTLWQAGYGLSVDGSDLGIVTVLPQMLRETGYQQIRTQAHLLEFSAGTEAWTDVHRHLQAIHSQQKASLEKINQAMPEDLDQWYQQALVEMLAPDFCGMWHLVTVMGIKA